MKLNTPYVVTDVVTLVEDAEQLKLFEKNQQMNETPLKYPRRSSRVIANKKYSLNEPSEIVSNTMKNVPSLNTKIEQLLEAELIRNKVNYTRPEYLIEQVEGKPDFILPRHRIALFCDGDFWHGHNYEKGSIKNNADFWDAKIENNILRDSEVSYGLKKKDWKVFRFWESDLKKDPAKCLAQVLKYIDENSDKIEHKFTFVDLFSGIGGFRIPLEELGGKCLGFSEINKQSIEVYEKNFIGYRNQSEIKLGDITQLGKLPFEDIDLIVGGVPCQAWSVAGKMKGFEDPRGRLWHDSIRIITENKPKAFIFENVKGLIDPRNRENLDLIIESFVKAGYIIKKPQLLNSYDFGLPQNRDRVFLVGIRKDLKNYVSKIEYPEPLLKKPFLKDFMDGMSKNVSINKMIFEPKEIYGEKIPMGRNRIQKANELNDFFIFCDTRNGHTTIHSWDIIKTTDREKEICMTILKNRRKKIYGLSDGNPISFKQLKTLIVGLKEDEVLKLVDKKILRFKEKEGYEFVNSKNSSGINGIYRVYLSHAKIFSTLTATGTKDMIATKEISETNAKDYKIAFINEIVKTKAFRPITAKEAGKLQGFPGWFSIHPDSNVAKKQFGNAVSTSVILYLSRRIVESNVFIKVVSNDKARTR